MFCLLNSSTSFFVEKIQYLKMIRCRGKYYFNVENLQSKIKSNQALNEIRKSLPLK